MTKFGVFDKTIDNFMYGAIICCWNVLRISLFSQKLEFQKFSLHSNCLSTFWYNTVVFNFNTIISLLTFITKYDVILYIQIHLVYNKQDSTDILHKQF